MEQIPLSDNSQRLARVFSDLYEQKRIFTEERRVQRTPELLDFLDEFALSLARDIRAHATAAGYVSDAESKLRFNGTLLFNAKYLVSSCDICYCYYGVWDADTGECYDLGAQYTSLLASWFFLCRC
jgi:hypothetical protein